MPKALDTTQRDDIHRRPPIFAQLRGAPIKQQLSGIVNWPWEKSDQVRKIFLSD